MKFINSLLTEMRSVKNGIDIGDNFRVMKVGHDVNGNWSYWLSHGGGRAKKVQATNINGGSGKISDIRDFAAPESADTIDAIKAYVLKYS